MDTGPTHMLVDPDLQNASGALDWSGSTKPKSNSHRQGRMGQFWTDPVHMLYKKKRSGSDHSSLLVLSLLRLLSSFFLQTLTLTVPILPRNGSYMA